MPRHVEAVVPSRFPGWVRERPFAIVFLGDGLRVNKPELVLHGLDTLFPGQIAVGWMARDAVKDPRWWQQHWRTELGPFVRQGAPPEGTYLFHLAWVAGHHPGTASAGTRDDWLRVRAYLVDRIRLKQSHGGDETEWTRQTEPGGGTRTPPPPRRPRPRHEGPYEILEVASDASDDEVRAAYRTALKLNHPDRCAKLSRQIQAFAKERTQLIVAAWEEIRAERGLR